MLSARDAWFFSGVWMYMCVGGSYFLLGKDATALSVGLVVWIGTSVLIKRMLPDKVKE